MVFSPDDNVVGLVDKSGLSDKGKFYFYASQPKLDGTINFNRICGSVENIASILGCYVDDRIFIYDIYDLKLEGIREVTAAHEMLHAAYARLNKYERIKVDKLLINEYEKIKDSKSFSSRMEFYSKVEPGQINNELHSLIGTEVADISPELEDYYKKYFKDRKIILNLNSKYLNAFQQLRDKAELLRLKINNIDIKIADKSDDYNLNITNLNQDVLDFNDKVLSGFFTVQSQLDLERDNLNFRVYALKLVRSEIESEISERNKAVDEYNLVAAESMELHNSIDSTLAPEPSL